MRMCHSKGKNAVTTWLPGNLASVYLAKLLLFQNILPLGSIVANFVKIPSILSTLSSSGPSAVLRSSKQEAEVMFWRYRCVVRSAEATLVRPTRKARGVNRVSRQFIVGCQSCSSLVMMREDEFDNVMSMMNMLYMDIFRTDA